MAAARTPNGVPILELGEESADEVQRLHEAALDPDDPEQLRTGARVFLHNPSPLAVDFPTVETVIIGGSTIDEAVKEVVTIFDDVLARQDPTWVASTDPDLARFIAEHYNCDIKSMDEELTA